MTFGPGSRFELARIGLDHTASSKRSSSFAGEEAASGPGSVSSLRSTSRPPYPASETDSSNQRRCEGSSFGFTYWANSTDGFSCARSETLTRNVTPSPGLYQLDGSMPNPKDSTPE